MSNLKVNFTIKELENIAGVSAHVIRKWEKRYNLFQPDRDANNIRSYDLNHLQYLLNITLLQNEGYKISKIANYSKEEVFGLAKNVVDSAFNKEYALIELKKAMYRYDEDIFEQWYQKAITENSFSMLFKNSFLPFLQFIGLFWQTKTVTIAHEHFITNLIIQKIQLNIAKIGPIPKSSSDCTFVLYLPEEEMHEIGLLFLHYELRLKGYRTIYLGRSVPFPDLASLKLIYPNICWISNFIIMLKPKKRIAYFQQIKTFLANTKHEYWAIGQNLSLLTDLDMPENIKVFHSIKEVLDKI